MGPAGVLMIIHLYGFACSDVSWEQGAWCGRRRSRQSRWSSLWCQFYWPCRLYFIFYLCFYHSNTFILGKWSITWASYCQPLRIQITFWKMSVKFIYTADGRWNKWYFAASRFKNRASCHTFWSLSCDWDNVLGLVDLPCVFVLSFCVKLADLSVWAESRCLLVCKKNGFTSWKYG